MARNILKGIRNLIGKMRGRPKPSKVRTPIPLGHRGQALGSIAKPDLSAENIAKWKPTDEGEAFIYEQMPFFVHSSNVQMFQFFIEEQKMMVEFKDGKAYMVSPISTQEAINFFKAPSKGAAYWDYVRVRGKGNAGKSKKNVTRIK